MLEFVEQSEALRQMFAEGLKDGKLFVDSPITFRANRAGEIGGDHIIDWEFQTGDQIAKYPDPVKGLRWAWGNPVRVSLRFAKDSPETPVANPDGKVDGLMVTYEAHDPWALLPYCAIIPDWTPTLGQASQNQPESFALSFLQRLVARVLPQHKQAERRSYFSTSGAGNGTERAAPNSHRHLSAESAANFSSSRYCLRPMR